MFDFSPVLFVFCQFFTLITVGDVDLCFSFLLVIKTIAVEEAAR
jgi:hypothetical protein